MNKLLIILLLVSTTVFSHENVITNFLDGYVLGNTSRMGITSNTVCNKNVAAQDVYQTLFVRTTSRHLTLKNVRWSTNRITSDFYAIADGVETSGSLTLFIDKDDKLTKIYHNNIVYLESETTSADAGQIADKASTVAIISTHTGVEANPLLAGMGPAGFLVLGGGIVAYRNGLANNESLQECIAGSRSLGSFGWGAASNNVAVLVGLGPVGLPVGLIAGISSYHKNYKGDCVDGPVRIASISSK